MSSTEVFSYRAAKDGTVFINWHGRCVTTLRGQDAERFLQRAEQAGDRQAQSLLARATGNFKRGNER